MWVRALFGGPERVSEERWPLAIVPRPVRAADRVVVGDRAAAFDDRIERGRFDDMILFCQRAVAAERVEREIGRGPVRIDMGEAAGDLSGPPRRFSRWRPPSPP